MVLQSSGSNETSCMHKWTNVNSVLSEKMRNMTRSLAQCHSLDYNNPHFPKIHMNSRIYINTFVWLPIIRRGE